MDKGRVYINDDGDTKGFLDNSKILNKEGLKRKDHFLIAMGLGYKIGSKIPFDSGKTALFFRHDFNEDDLSLIYALAVKDTGDVKVVSDSDKVISIAEDYANTGFKYLMKIEKETSLEKQDKEFEKMVVNQIKELNL
jgi:hypothetical protein